MVISPVGLLALLRCSGSGLKHGRKTLDIAVAERPILYPTRYARLSSGSFSSGSTSTPTLYSCAWSTFGTRHG